MSSARSGADGAWSARTWPADRSGRWSPGAPGPGAVAIASARSMWASVVPMRQDQDRQAGHDRGDGPRRPRHPGLGQQVVGDLPGHAEREGADRGPPGEPAGPVADRRRSAGEPGAQRVRRVRLDADRQGDGRVQVQRGPDARQRGDQPEPGLLRDADPAGPHLGRGRGGQDQQRPGPARSWCRSETAAGPVRAGWSGGPGRGRTSLARIRGGAGAVHGRGECGHGGHHPSGVASGWGSPVSAARAVATSWTAGADVGRRSRPCRCRCRCGRRRRWATA